MSSFRLTLLALALVVTGCQRPASTLATDPTEPFPDRRSAAAASPGDRLDVRVALTTSQSALLFEAVQSFRSDVGRAERGVVRARVEAGHVVLERGGRTLDAGVAVLHLRPERPADAAWEFGGDRFAGSLVLRVNGAGTLDLINELPVEVYLRGVVPWEIGRPGTDAKTAVEAQAIAARTYTYSHLGHYEESGFDVYADTRDQVYRGVSGTAEVCDRAIRDSVHQVLVYDGKLIRAYYSSTSGGHTATLTDVWTREGAPYLVGRPDRDERGRAWSSDSPYFRWTEVWSAAELGRIIRQNLPAELDSELTPWDIGRVEAVRVVARDPSGRVQRLAIVTDRAEFEVWGDRIRWVLRPAVGRFGILRSTMFELEERREGGALVGLIARGGGFGHGVGLCQTGALARARAGQSAREILRFYYRGTEVVDVRGLASRIPSR